MWRHGLFVEDVVTELWRYPWPAKRFWPVVISYSIHAEGKNICAAVNGFAL